MKEGMTPEQAQARLAALRLDVPTGAGPHVHGAGDDDNSHDDSGHAAAAPEHREMRTTELVMRSLHEETVGDVRGLGMWLAVDFTRNVPVGRQCFLTGAKAGRMRNREPHKAIPRLKSNDLRRMFLLL